jgi:hypothetical protein
MNTYTNIIAVFSVVSALSAAACTAESTDVDTTVDELSARVPSRLVGSWDVPNFSNNPGSVGSLVLSSNNTYLLDVPGIQRGTVPVGLTREFGKVSVNANKHTLTAKGGSKSVSYSYALVTDRNLRLELDVQRLPVSIADPVVTYRKRDGEFCGAGTCSVSCGKKCEARFATFDADVCACTGLP